MGSKFGETEQSLYARDWRGVEAGAAGDRNAGDSVLDAGLPAPVLVARAQTMRKNTKEVLWRIFSYIRVIAGG
jgi:hypothetical protein